MIYTASVSVLSDWPTYLLKNIPPEVRTGIEQDEHLEGSMAEVIRRILCAHYDLDCEFVVARNKFIRVAGTDTMVLRLQPELWKQIKWESKRREVTTRTVIIDALEAHYLRSAVT